jgi:hypothetical protein
MTAAPPRILTPHLPWWQLLVEPRDVDDNIVGWLEGEVDMIADRSQVLSVLGRFDHVRLSLHGHVHANSITTRNGIVYATIASPLEYPMQWREVRVSKCQVELRAHTLAVPEASRRSRELETRLGRNDAKKGSDLANHVVIEICGAADTER